MPRGVTSLSRQRIVEVAAELADEQGIDQLKMRELAARLGAGTMSIYHHLPDKLALKRALADHLWSQLQLPDPALSWTERLRQITTQVWTIGTRHPALVPLLLTRRFTGPEGLPAVEALLDAARAGGYDPAGSVRCFRVLIGYAAGMAQAETARSTAEPDRPTAEPGRQPPPHGGPASFPNLRAALAEANAERAADEFAFGLELLLAGIEQHAPTSSLP